MADWYSKMADGSAVLDGWFTAMIEMAGTLAAIYAVQVLLRMRAEEAQGRLEPVLAGAVGRTRWVTSYLVTAGLGAVAILLVFALGMGLMAGLVLGDTAGTLGDLIAAALAQLPAVLVVAGAVLAVFALAPRRAVAVSWLLLGAAILLSPVWGTSLGLPEWTLDLSPFSYEEAPAAEIGAVAAVVLVGIAVALGAAGLTAFRRRDLAQG
jgi:ABC-2 type transport system permease protein